VDEYSLGDTNEANNLFALLNAGVAAGINVGLAQIGSQQQITTAQVVPNYASAGAGGMGLLLLAGLAYLVLK
jgi:hypothetical protein